MADKPMRANAVKVDAIAELFGSSDLGKAFLDGLAQSQRDTDLDRIFKALDRLESHAGTVREEVRVENLREELRSMSEAIIQTRNEIASIKPDSESSNRIMAATEELDAIITATERATSDILGAAERIQAATQGLREGGIDERICNLLDEQSTNIFMACSFQDITGQRVSKVVNLLRYLEQRINAMVGLWVAESQKMELADTIDDLPYDLNDERPDAHLLSGPARDGEGVSQDDIDELLNGEAEMPQAEEEAAPEPVAEPVAEAAPEPAPQPAADPAPAAEETEIPAGETVNQDDIDALFG